MQVMSPFSECSETSQIFFLSPTQAFFYGVIALLRWKSVI